MLRYLGVLTGVFMSMATAQAGELHEYRTNLSYGTQTQLAVYINDVQVFSEHGGNIGASDLFLNAHLKPGTNRFRVVVSTPEVPLTATPTVAKDITRNTYLLLALSDALYTEKGDEYEVTTTEDTREWRPADNTDGTTTLPHVIETTIDTPTDYDPNQKP